MKCFNIHQIIYINKSLYMLINTGKCPHCIDFVQMSKLTKIPYKCQQQLATDTSSCYVYMLYVYHI